MFTPELKLIPEDSGRFTLAASIPVPNAGFKVRSVRRKAPDSQRVAKGVIAVQIFVDGDAAGSPGEPATLSQTIPGLRIPEGGTVRVFIMQGATLLGESSIVRGPATVFRTTVLASAEALVAQQPMTPDLAQGVVVKATPFPEKFKSVAQALVELGVIDTTQTSRHKAKIQSSLSDIGFSISTSDIKSGPGISVATCRDSVVANAS